MDSMFVDDPTERWPVDADEVKSEPPTYCFSYQSLIMAASTPALKCLTIPAVAKHTATVVFIHVSIRIQFTLSKAFLLTICPCRSTFSRA